jgi:hypothetical protein
MAGGVARDSLGVVGQYSKAWQRVKSAGKQVLVLAHVEDGVEGGEQGKASCDSRILRRLEGVGSSFGVSNNGDLLALLEKGGAKGNDSLTVYNGPFTTSAPGELDGGIAVDLGGEEWDETMSCVAFFWSPDSSKLLFLTSPSAVTNRQPWKFLHKFICFISPQVSLPCLFQCLHLLALDSSFYGRSDCVHTRAHVSMTKKMMHAGRKTLPEDEGNGTTVQMECVGCRSTYSTWHIHHSPSTALPPFLCLLSTSQTPSPLPFPALHIHVDHTKCPSSYSRKRTDKHLAHP